MPPPSPPSPMQPPQPQPPSPGACTDNCYYSFDGYCDDGGPGSLYSDCALGDDCYDCGMRLYPSPPAPAYPPVSPAPSSTAILLGVPVVTATFVFPPHLTTQADVTNLTRALAAHASCEAAAPAIGCEVARDMRVGPTIDRPTNLSSLAFLLTFPSTLPQDGAVDADGRPTATIDPAAAARATEVHHGLQSVALDPQSELADVMASLGIAAHLSATLSATSAVLYLPPSPPPALPPPAAPPGLCSDSCDAATGTPGVCNDGGAGDPAPFLQLCPLGSDCADCGSRDYCIDCSDECQTRNERLSSEQQAQACMQSQYTNSACDAACNNRECGYDDGVCTYSQIEASCLSVQDNAQVDYSTKPLSLGLTLGRAGGFERVPAVALERSPAAREAGLVPVALSLNLEPTRTILQQEFNENFIFAEMGYTLQWQDPRLRRSPCAGALNGMLSLTFEQGLSDIARERARSLRTRFWVPTIQAGSGSVPGYRAVDDSAAFSLAYGSGQESMEWLEGYGGPLPPSAHGQTSAAAEAANAFVDEHVTNSSGCVDCATWEGDIELQLLQSHHSFFYYPFDQQELRVTVFVPGAHLYMPLPPTARRQPDSPSRTSLVPLTSSPARHSLLAPPAGTAAWARAQTRPCWRHSSSPSTTRTPCCYRRRASGTSAAPSTRT